MLEAVNVPIKKKKLAYSRRKRLHSLVEDCGKGRVSNVFVAEDLIAVDIVQLELDARDR